MTTSLGLSPDELVVHLTDGADFITTMEAEPAWPDGTVLTLVFDTSEVWTADVTGADATWTEDKSDADDIVDKTGVRLKYTNGTDEITLAIGKVVRHG